MTDALDRLATREDEPPPPPPTIGQVIQRMIPEIQRALPKGMDGDRIARLALTVLRTDQQAAIKRGKPKDALVNCTPESFAGALLGASALGLEPGVNGEAYLVAYAGECTLIVGYQGFAKLFWQHPMAKHLDAQAVYSGDEFDYGYGLTPFLIHKPLKTGGRGTITHYYAVGGLTSGASGFVVLTVDEVKALRANTRSQQIRDPQHWMERKTALRQLVKLLPKSPMLARAISADERSGSDLHAEQVAEITPTDGAPALPVGTDQVTGEVLDAVPVEDPPAEPDWPTHAQPGSGARKTAGAQ